MANTNKPIARAVSFSGYGKLDFGRPSSMLFRLVKNSLGPRFSSRNSPKSIVEYDRRLLAINGIHPGRSAANI